MASGHEVPMKGMISAYADWDSAITDFVEAIKASIQAVAVVAYLWVIVRLPMVNRQLARITTHDCGTVGIVGGQA